MTEAAPPPVLEVEGLSKHFPVRKGLLRRTVGHVYAVDERELHDWSGRDAGTGRGIGLRQDHGGAHHHAPDRADRRRHPPRRPRRDPPRQVGDAPLPPADPDHLPGPVLFAEPQKARGRYRRRAAQGARRAGDEGAARAGGRAVRARRPAQGADGQFPAPVLGRPAPAHRRRPRPGPQPAADHRRRAGVGARRLDPGPGHQPADGPAARAEALLPLHLAQPRRGGAHRSPRRRHVSGPHRRIHRQDHALHQAAAPLHRGAARRRARPRPRHQARQARGAGRRAESPEAAAGLPLPHPLPLRRGALPPGECRPCARSSPATTWRVTCAECTARGPTLSGTGRQPALSDRQL